jgi:lysozyme
MIDAGYQIIKKWEGLVDGDPDTPGLDPYLDPIGIPTMGWGSIWGFDKKRVTMAHPPITKGEAQVLLEREVRHTEAAMSHLVRANLNENEHAAVVSLAYNIGTGNLQASTLLRKLNRGDKDGAADEFPKWRRAGGRILRGLVLRRADERALFLA